MEAEDFRVLADRARSFILNFEQAGKHRSVRPIKLTNEDDVEENEPLISLGLLVNEELEKWDKIICNDITGFDFEAAQDQYAS